MLSVRLIFEENEKLTFGQLNLHSQENKRGFRLNIGMKLVSQAILNHVSNLPRGLSIQNIASCILGECADICVNFGIVILADDYREDALVPAPR